MTYEHAASLNMAQAVHAAGWLETETKTVTEARSEAGDKRDEMFARIAHELRMSLEQVASLPTSRLAHEVRSRLPEHVRGQAVDVSPEIVSESIERLKRK